MKIVVLGGGISTERHVSLVTSVSVCRALRSLGHQAIFVDMYFGMEAYDGELEAAFDAPDGLCPDALIGHAEPDLEEVKRSRKWKSRSRIGKNVLEICSMADCVFLGLHGEDGEDGKIQAVLDLLGIPYTGSDVLGSAVAMDKGAAKAMMVSVGIPTSPWKEYDLAEAGLAQILPEQKFPCVVKVINGGSSIGVYICDNADQLVQALIHAEKFNSRILIEEKKTGREFTVPILDGKPLQAIEIIPPEGNTTFDYVAKYQSGSEGAREICPADIPAELQEKLGSLALRLHRALGLAVYSRTDFIVDREGNPWCLEVNTLPGMTPNSLIPRAAKLEGLDYAKLCERIVSLSIKK